MIIAVDGPAASGKGTLATRLAAHYGLRHLDTGLLYRAVGHEWAAFETAHDAAEHAVRIAQNLDASALDAELLSTPEIGQLASKVAAITDVRVALLAFQRAFAANPQGAVLDGRDIGTVICPNADAKLYVTARPEVRAERRALQMEARGMPIDRANLLADIKARDERDMGRADAPLTMSSDAHLLDTSDLDIESALRASIAIVDRAVADKAER